MPNESINIDDWRRSIISLAFELAVLRVDNSLLTPASHAKGEYFFSDAGIPRPRPSTALAWASLCAIGPVTGFRNIETEEHIPFSLTAGRFIIPFLPKILYNENTSLSLARQSRAHAKNPFGQIRWGNIFVASAESGEIIETIAHGNRDCREFIDVPAGARLETNYEQSDIPPLYGKIGEGWQFGIVQNIPSMTIHVRDPFTELAQNGIIETKNARGLCPKIRRLLFRFLDVNNAREWAAAYAQAQIEQSNESTVRDDRLHLAEQIIESRQRKKAKSEGLFTEGNTKALTDDFMSQFLGKS